MQISEIVDRFLKWCAHHRADSTCRQYRSRLRIFRARFADRSLAELTPLDIQEFLDDYCQGKAPDTQRAAIIVVERLQSWAVEMKLLDAPILTKIEKPRGRTRNRLPTREETAAILATGSREFCVMYRALRTCGARPNELCRATIDDLKIEPVENEAGEIETLEYIELAEHKTAKKTGKPRIIVVGKDLRALIDESLNGRTAGHLFHTPTGKPWTVSGLGSAFRRIRTRAGLASDLVVYLTRHEHGTRVCELHGIQAAADALGHSDVKTTSTRYVKKNRRLQRDRQEGLFDDEIRRAA